VSGSGVRTRRLALDALERIDDGAYSNLVLPGLLGGSGLDERDRAFVTDLVYGTTRMRRACDWVVDRRLRGPVEPAVRRVLRLGAYQLVHLRVAPHAAVSATVDVAPPRARGLVNAVLRRLAEEPEPPWPDPAVRLSYPDWIVRRLAEDLGPGDALAALERMNRPPEVSVRADGYVQDRASQWVADMAGAGGGLVADLCAGPGGKATAMARRAGRVVACDLNPVRAGLVAGNAARLGLANVVTVVGDASRPPLARAAFDAVLVDAPCSGLGVLRRRPDARWRLEAEAVERLADLQRRILSAAAGLVRPGGVLTYSVCTLASAETVGIDRWAQRSLAGFEATAAPGDPWRQWGRGALLLPQSADTDGMFVLCLRRTG